MTNDVQFEFMGLNPDDKIRSFVFGKKSKKHIEMQFGRDEHGSM